jgi:hypothetical protein
MSQHHDGDMTSASLGDAALIPPQVKHLRLNGRAEIAVTVHGQRPICTGVRAMGTTNGGDLSKDFFVRPIRETVVDPAIISWKTYLALLEPVIS